jgi:hypothetical protein
MGVEVATMSTKQAEPSWVPEQRARKADKIASTLRAIGATADEVAHFTEQDRRMAEAAATVRRGSATTWRIVTEMLAGSARPEALCPTCGMGDPEGEIGPRKAYRHPGACTR